MGLFLIRGDGLEGRDIVSFNGRILFTSMKRGAPEIELNAYFITFVITIIQS